MSSGLKRKRGHPSIEDRIAGSKRIDGDEQIEREGLLARAAHIEEVLGDGLRGLAAKHPCIAEVRGKGAMLAIEIVKPGSLEHDPELVARVIDFAAQRGVLLLSAGVYGNVIRFLPSLQFTDELCALVVRVLDDAFSDAEA